MTSGLIFCIDGGGTKTAARLYASNGSILAETFVGPGNITSDPKEAARNVALACCGCAKKAGIDSTVLSSSTLVIGSAGSLPSEPRAVFIKNLPTVHGFHLMTDGYAALLGAGEGAPSAMIIAGTGAAGHRLYANGTSIRRDGWGWMLGDRGSGAWIGMQSIRHAAAVFDMTEPPSILSDAVLNKASTTGGLPGLSEGLLPSEVADFAKIVFSCANRGDAVAESILDEAAGHLSRLVLSLDLDEDTPVFFAGGLASLMEAVVSQRTRRIFAKPAGDALYGCYLVGSNLVPHENLTHPIHERNC